jgi:hypothetical protein
VVHPENWRIHPEYQQEALAGVLEQVGCVQDVIVNRRTGRVVDGHLRVALAISRSERVPVVYVDLAEEEERQILARSAQLPRGNGRGKARRAHSGSGRLKQSCGFPACVAARSSRFEFLERQLL